MAIRRWRLLSTLALIVPLRQMVESWREAITTAAPTVGGSGSGHHAGPSGGEDEA